MMKKLGRILLWCLLIVPAMLLFVVWCIVSVLAAIMGVPDEYERDHG